MKISIDTKEDSPEEIRGLIRMLLALVGDAAPEPSRAPPATGEGLFDMFGNPEASTAEQQQMGKNDDGSMDVNAFIDDSQQQPDGKDDDYKVVPY